MVGERGKRHVGILLSLKSDPFQSQRDGHRARSPWPDQSPGRSRLGSEMTPGFPFAAPGPTDGVGSLAYRSTPLPRIRALGLARLWAMLGCGWYGRHVDPRYYGPLRLPNAHPEVLRAPA